ncbi:MAG: sigma-70 family RNA polymerase sigma factor [Caldilinea sp. CFX5]|nr:sigma-70 family RNA polymerase sigma factor [Caldilinea sp. CFX5]
MTELRVLVEAAQDGDRTAFGEIVTRFQDMAFAGAFALLGDVQSAQDAAQEAFWEAYRNLTKLREPAAFPGWFQRIVVGRAYRELRRQPVTLLPLESMADMAGNQPDPAEQVLTQQQQAEIAQALATLPEAQRLAVTLFYIEGYSYQEIADFLEAPLSTVKKRLFDARRKLKGRMLHMVQEKLQQAKPSQAADFAQKIQFFLALRDQDLGAIKTLVKQNPALLTAQTEWPMALGHYYRPPGSTALHLTAATGTTEMLAYLLAQPVDREAPDRNGMTPLHLAAIMGQAANVQLLLDHGANSNALSPIGQTPLHHAVLRDHLRIAEILLQNGATVDLPDQAGRTPMNWAVIRNNSAMVELLTTYGAQRPATLVASGPSAPVAPPAALDVTQLLGTIVTSADAVPQGAKAAGVPAEPLAGPDAAPLLPTGIKIIDLLAPLVRGGQNGIFTPLSGVGQQVVISQIIYSMKALHNGYTVWLFLENDRRRAAEQKLVWREAGVDEQIVYVAGKSDDTPAAHRQTVATGLAIAEQFQRAGHNVLLLVESRLAESEGVMAALRTNTSVTPTAAITTLIYGNHTPGVLPAVYSGLDSVLAFDYTRAVHRLYPAIDPVRSASTLLQRGLLSPEHSATAAAVKRLLQRYGELRAPMEQYKMGSDALWYIEDDPNLHTDINSARRLDRFLTQPFHGAEPWSGLVGKLTPVAETIAGCQALLTGQYNALPEEAFAYVGALAEAVAKANASA